MGRLGGRARSRLPAYVLALVVACTAVTGSTATAVPNEPAPTGVGGRGIGDRYFPVDGNGGIDVLSYDVRDRYGFAERRLSGTTRLRVRATRALRAFHLDLLLPVRRVLVDGRPARFHKPSPHELRITPRRRLPAGARFSVVVSYAGLPDTIFWRGEHGWLASDDEMVTIGQPHMAAWWFAANDHPSDKATMDVRLTTDAAQDVVSNGRLVGRTTHGRLATTRWRSHQPMAPYLAFVAAGDFRIVGSRHRGRPSVLAVSRAIPAAQRTAAMRLLRTTPMVTRWLERELGPYPFGASGGVVTSLNPGFALETQTRPVYPVVDEAAGPSLVVHELSHQWFGDSVSLRRWRDIWLNEGLATYAEARWNETHGGESGGSRLGQWYDEHALDHDFWAFPLADPGPTHLFAREVYLRGAMTVLALRQRIGHAVLHRLLRAWVARHRGGTVTSADFVSLAEQVSGQDLDSFFDAWLFGARRPGRTAENGL